MPQTDSCLLLITEFSGSLRSSPNENDAGLHGCGLSDRVKRDMERIQRSAEIPADVYTNYMTM